MSDNWRLNPMCSSKPILRKSITVLLSFINSRSKPMTWFPLYVPSRRGLEIASAIDVTVTTLVSIPIIIVFNDWYPTQTDEKSSRLLVQWTQVLHVLRKFGCLTLPRDPYFIVYILLSTFFDVVSWFMQPQSSCFGKGGCLCLFISPMFFRWDCVKKKSNLFWTRGCIAPPDLVKLIAALESYEH